MLAFILEEIEKEAVDRLPEVLLDSAYTVGLNGSIWSNKEDAIVGLHPAGRKIH